MRRAEESLRAERDEVVQRRPAGPQSGRLVPASPDRRLPRRSRDASLRRAHLHTVGRAGGRHQRVSPKGSPDARALSVGRQARRARPLLQRRCAARLRRAGLQHRGRDRSRAQHDAGARAVCRFASAPRRYRRCDLRLGEALAVSGVTSVEYGRLLHLRIRGQNTVLVNLPRLVSQDSDLTLVDHIRGTRYRSRSSTSTRSRSNRTRRNRAADSEATGSRSAPQQPRVSGIRRIPVPDYATASMRISVPPGYTCVASGQPVPAQRHRLASRHSRRARRWACLRSSAPISHCAISRSSCLDSRASARARSRIENHVGPGLRQSTRSRSASWRRAALRAQARSVPHADRRASCGSTRR